MQNQKLVNIAKFLAFILLMRGVQCTAWVFSIADFLYDNTIEKFWHDDFGLFDPVFTLLATVYIGIILKYFLAKKFGVVQFLNKFPFIAALSIIILMDILILARPDYYNTYDKHWVSGVSMTKIDFFLGFGFIYTFFTYKFVKFLSRKFKRFEFLEKLYPRTLEKIPNIYLLGFATILAYPSLKYEIDNASLGDETFIPYLILFFVIIAIFFTIELIKTIKKKQNK